MVLQVSATFATVIAKLLTINLLTDYLSSDFLINIHLITRLPLLWGLPQFFSSYVCLTIWR